MDVLVVRKLGVPGHEEYALGAIACGGVLVLDHQVVANLSLGLDVVEKVIQRETRELARRELIFRDARPPPEVAGRTVIVVDDGIATGSTVSAAIQLLRHQKAARIIVAAPVSARDSATNLRSEADAVVTLMEPADFRAVGEWSQDFAENSDEEVHRLLAVHRQWDAEQEHAEGWGKKGASALRLPLCDSESTAGTARPPDKKFSGKFPCEIG